MQISVNKRGSEIRTETSQHRERARICDSFETEACDIAIIEWRYISAGKRYGHMLLCVISECETH